MSCTATRPCSPWSGPIVEGRGARSEQILRDKNGKEIPVLVHTAPILNNEGEVELVLELSVDEQESRRLREELRVTRERFRQLFEESPCYVSVVGRDLQVRSHAPSAHVRYAERQALLRAVRRFVRALRRVPGAALLSGRQAMPYGKSGHRHEGRPGQRARLDRAFARHFGQHHRMHRNGHGHYGTAPAAGSARLPRPAHGLHRPRHQGYAHRAGRQRLPPRLRHRQGRRGPDP